MRGVENKLQIELICSMHMELEGKCLLGKLVLDVYFSYVFSPVRGTVLIMKRCSFPLETTYLRGTAKM